MITDLKTRATVMEASSLEACVSSEAIRQQEEYNFYRLKNIILDTVIAERHLTEDEIYEALMQMIESFKSFSFHSIRLSKWENACAYFYRFGAQGSGLTRFKVLDALKNSKDLVAKFQQPNLNIITLGGGPGNDIVGLTSALYESGIQSSLNITIMDSVSEWHLFANKLLVSIKKGNYGNSSRYFHENKVEISFFPAKLPHDFETDNVQNAIKEADIILMIRFISSFHIHNRPLIVEEVHKNMKSGAFALVIDAPYFEDHWTEFETLYLSEAGEYHYIVPNSKIRFGQYDCCSTKAHVSVLRKV